MLKRIAARLPAHWQQELKRAHFRRQIRRHTFATDEPEYAILHSLLAPGDWVIDVGANVGHYTRRFSELVGAAGRVIAFEPMNETFDLLTANARLFPHPNVSLLNVAASDHTGLAGMSAPDFESGLRNLYEARLVEGESELQVLTLAIDALNLPHRVSLVKIDAEGHDMAVLGGMPELLRRDLPVVIIESGRENVEAYLRSFGYAWEPLPASPNRIFRPSLETAAAR